MTKKTFNIVATLGLILVSASVVALHLNMKEENSSEPKNDLKTEYVASDYPPRTVDEPARVEVRPLKDFILSVMETCNSPLSSVGRVTRAEVLAPIFESRIRDREGQELYALVLCIENKFQAVGKSSVGATGIAQIMPKYAQDFANMCKLGTLGPGDLEDVVINVTIGACFFNHLLAELKSPVLAVAAYNAGAASSSVKNLKALGNPVHETAGYVAKMAYLKETINAKQTVDSN